MAPSQIVENLEEEERLATQHRIPLRPVGLVQGTESALRSRVSPFPVPVGNRTRLLVQGPDINDYSLAASNHGLGTTDINSGAGDPSSTGGLADPLPIIRPAHMSGPSSVLGCPVRFSPSPKPRLSIVSRWE